MVRYARSLTAGIGGLLIASVFLARTELVAGTVVAEKITALAQREGVEVEVRTIRPVGLTGLALIDVAARIPVRHQTVEFTADRVEVFPALGELLTGHLNISELNVISGYASVSDTSLVRLEKPDAPSKDAPPPDIKVERRKPNPIKLALSDVTIDLPFASGPVTLSHANATVRGRSFDQFKGYGQLPNGMRVSILKDPKVKKPSFLIKPEASLNLSEIVAVPIPSTEVQTIQVCPSCDVVAEVKDVRVKLGPGDVSIPSVGIRQMDGEFYDVVLDEIAYEGLPARIVDWKANVSPNMTGAGRVKVLADDGGSLILTWSVADEVTLFAHAERFKLAEWEEMNPWANDAQADEITGTFGITYERTSRLASVECGLKINGARIHVRRIANDPIEIPMMVLSFKALVDLDAHAYSVTSGTLKLEASDPITFHGRLVDGRNGGTFFARADAPRLNAVVVRDAMPRSMTKVIRGANIDGDFGFWMEVGGHTAYPESLFLDGELSGAVSVLTDSPDADVTALRAEGKPALDTIRTKRWRSYEAYPTIAPFVLLAAEDAQFFRHEGFDWAGFQRAMIHNMRKGELKRGASTLSQQVVKNLYLGGQRTISRKIQEMYLTWRLESEVEKRRILEIYMNIAPWGRGVHGFSEAAQHFFNDDIANLTVPELAILVSILPNPFIFGDAIKQGRFPMGRLEKFEHVVKNLRFLEKISYEQYVSFMRDAKSGTFGRIQLQICADGTPPLVENAPNCE